MLAALFLHSQGRAPVARAASRDERAARGQALTTTQLAARMTDVSKVTVYRQVALLAEGGLLEVDGEHRVRGAVERRYRLRRDRPVIDAGDAAAMSLEDHRRGFAAAMAVLIAEFSAYLDRAGADPVADSVGYRQGVFWLSPAELAEMAGEVLTILRSRLGNQPAPDPAVPAQHDPVSRRAAGIGRAECGIRRY